MEQKGLKPITFVTPESLTEIADYGIQSFEEVPTVKRHVSVGNKAYEDIERFRSVTNEPQGIFCGRIISAAIEQNFKPVAKAVQKNFKLDMQSEKSVVCYLKENDNIKLESLAKSLNLKTGDYIRLCLYIALKNMNQ